MNPANISLQYALLGETIAPNVVEDNGDVMYLGYVIDSCSSVSDAKWCIKRVLTWTTDDGATYRVISYAGGSRDYTHKWTERKSLTYPLSSSWLALTDDKLKQAVK